MKTTARHLLDKKGRTIWRVEPSASVYSAIEIMAAKAIGALLVMEGDTVVGIISERDYARKVILQGRSSRTTTVREIMTPKVLVIDPDTDVEAALALMSEYRIRHLPVAEDGKVIGIISSGDVVRGLVESKQFMIDQLTRYICGP